ncbi:DUF5107 domain-containing protein [Agriterribacter sp.]|uniref:DUF5107 domain-containing protein n=1 Tax=Agriterribacter sp. TaxID=2821509 RepID=UPI002BA936F1|nr:DUF5107 domain-containing protein [Agriterribacter sp.]HRP57391.1 DUF5107 domain-containing protein [Agriterribacter sp.]
MIDTVKVWEEEVIIPTYETGQPEKNPMFLEKRVYQGSSGVVYPHAVIEKICDVKKDKAYTAVFIENKYIRVMILPQIGGRIQMAFDKIKNRHFVYYNHVIKPALVGLTGPWISGGIEFNWPQHHRPSTFEPVDHTIIENPDGSKTIWVNEVERMFRTKGMAGFTLYPGKAYIEVKGNIYNRTPFPQTFLWWANPAVKVNDHYQSVFPPDVHAVFDHGKRDVSSFPIAKGVYYKVNYAPGTDISRYKNIPVPTSYMAVSSRYNFMGGYEHDSKGGLLHVADHHIAPGKKQWTWGNGEFGRTWDANLTDEDGPYIELMTGVFTDNQPDFSWIQPYEEKTFVQYFMPYSEVGVVKNATKEAMVNLEIKGSEAEIKLYVTSAYEKIKVALVEDEAYIFTETISSSPENPYLKKITLRNGILPEAIKLLITDLSSGKELVSYQKEKHTEQPVPPPAQAAKKPADVENNEQLFLTGLHLEQYRHATYMPTDYYEEALQRDPSDTRSNNALGLWLLRRGQFKAAEPYFRAAVKTLTQRNPNPYDGEAYYNLGWSLKLQGKHEEAFACFYKSVWNDAWQHAGYLNLARIAAGNKDFEQALELIERSLIRNYHSHTARHLKVVLLRKQGSIQEAAALIEESIGLDPFNFGCLFEKNILFRDQNPQLANEAKEQLCGLSRNWVHNYIEYALDYAHAGLYDEAIEFFEIYLAHAEKPYPMVFYYLGWFESRRGNEQKCNEYYCKATSLSVDYCFPNRIEDVIVLEEAKRANAEDMHAPYLLGNFWYDRRQYKEAVACWERAVQIDDSFPTVHRNLSLAYYNKLNDPQKALASLEKAFSLDTTDARVLMELDQLYKRLNKPHRERLSLLETHLSLVGSRDDLYLERVVLYNHLEAYQTARNLLAEYKFHPWEGGEGKVVGQYMLACIELAKQALADGNARSALELLDQAGHYPENLSEGKLSGAQENDIFYLKGLAYEKLSNAETARSFFIKATQGMTEPVQAIFYNDPQPDKIIYQGLGWCKLGEKQKATQIFTRLIDFGKNHINDKVHIDYFAVSLPDLLVFDADLDLRNKIHCLYLQGLGYLGLGHVHAEKAEKFFNEVLKLDINHSGAIVHKHMLKYLFITEP